MAIGYSPEPRELLYHSVDYNNPVCIQGLLRHYYDLRSKAREKMNTELMCIYVDIEKAIKNINLTNQQKKVLYYYMEGWTEYDIAEFMGITRQVAHNHLSLVIKKISKFLNMIDA